MWGDRPLLGAGRGQPDSRTLQVGSHSHGLAASGGLSSLEPQTQLRGSVRFPGLISHEHTPQLTETHTGREQHWKRQVSLAGVNFLCK